MTLAARLTAFDGALLARAPQHAACVRKRTEPGATVGSTGCTCPGPDFDAAVAAARTETTR